MCLGNRRETVMKQMGVALQLMIQTAMCSDMFMWRNCIANVSVEPHASESLKAESQGAGPGIRVLKQTPLVNSKLETHC